MPNLFDICKMTLERESLLFREARIVFDSSAISHLYTLVEDHKKTMVDILCNYKDRIWIPSHVSYEYQKNIESFRNNPLKLYDETKFKQSLFFQNIDNILNNFDHPYFHPYIEEDDLKRLKEIRDIAEQKIKDLQKGVKEQVKKRTKEISDVKDNDIIKETISSFMTGKTMSFDELMEIVKEGEFRFRNLLPPGHEDKNNSHKLGMQIYGDLIIWKEILNYAKEKQASIIYIIDDTKKDIYQEHDKDKEPESPRHELLKEFHDVVGKDIWFYTTKKFIELLCRQIKDSETLELYKGLDNVKNTLEKREEERIRHIPSNSELKLKCKDCKEIFSVQKDDFCFDWNETGWSESEMGTETMHESIETCTCPSCKKQIELSFQVFEYPRGTFECQEIESSDASIYRPLDLSKCISFPEYESCVRCGQHNILNAQGLCEDCEYDYIEFMRKD